MVGSAEGMGGVTVIVVRVVFAPDSFGGTLSAVEAVESMITGWRSCDSTFGDELVGVPMSDGGPGFVEVIAAGLRRSARPPGWTPLDPIEEPEVLLATVSGPLGEPVPVTIAMADRIAYLESAQACGLHLMRLDERDPWRAGSRGLGEMIARVLDAGAERVVIGLGGTGTVDAGAGMLAALGAHARSRTGDDVTEWMCHGPAAFADLAWVDLGGTLRESMGVDLVAACDVDVPLTGPSGAARGFAAQKFADPQQATAEELTRLDTEVMRFAELVRSCGELPDLTEREGAGAAGGIGWALLTLGATAIPGADIVATAVDLDGALDGADLVVTGEGRLDWQSRRGKVVSAVAQRASSRGIPVVAIAGRLDLGTRELAAMGIVEAWALAEQPGGLARSMISAHAVLTDTAARVAAQWRR